jgi:hypothetical protein
MSSVENDKQYSLSNTAIFFYASTAVADHVHGHTLNLEMVLIGSMVQFAPIWIMQYVFCRQAEPELTYAPLPSLALSSTVRLW